MEPRRVALPKGGSPKFRVFFFRPVPLQIRPPFFPLLESFSGFVLGVSRTCTTPKMRGSGLSGHRVKLQSGFFSWNCWLCF